MNPTIGTAQVALNIPSSFSGYNYYCRWSSINIGQTSISANTWTFSFGYNTPFGTNDNGVQVCIYVWRPSTSTKIGTVCDASVAQAFNSSETGYKLTIAGSAVTGIQGTDVLCVEFMVNCFSTTVSLNFYYDGTTVVATNNTAASSVAAYIETPETISLGVRALTTSLSHSLAFTDSNTKTRNKIRPFTNTMTLADSYAKIRNKIRPVSQSLALTDSINRPRLVKTLSDAMSFVSSLLEVRGKFGQFSETMSFAEDLFRSGETKVKTLASSITLSDSYKRTTTRLRPLSHSLTLADQHIRLRNKIQSLMSDSISFSDNSPFGTVRTKWRQISETLTSVDSYDKITTRIRTLAHSLGFVDAPVGSKLKMRSFDDSISFSDAITSVYRNFWRQLIDEIDFQDDYAKMTTRIRTFTNSMSFVSIHSKIRNIGRSASSSIALSSVANRTRLKAKSFADLMTLSSSVTRLRGRWQQFANSLALSSSLAKMTTRIRPLNHALQFIDKAVNNLPTGPRMFFVRLITFRKG